VDVFRFCQVNAPVPVKVTAELKVMLPNSFGVRVAVAKVMALVRVAKVMLGRLELMLIERVADVFRLLLSMFAVSCGNGKFVDDTAPPLDVAHCEVTKFADVVPTK
jgi:hypothetical protein